MDKSITRFFSDLGIPLRNQMWSWGARRDNVIVLRTWADEYDVKSRRVALLRRETLLGSASAGLDERLQHVKAIWNGGIAAYTVIATAQDPTAKRRVIESYRDALFPIEALDVGVDGTLFARCAKLIYVSPREFHQHSANHRTQTGDGPFPVDAALESGLSTASFHEKLPHIRSWLIDLARHRSTAQYGDVMRGYDVQHGTLFNALKALGEQCVAASEPVITSLVVDKNGRCSIGLFDVFGIADDAAERERCYRHWNGEPEEAVDVALTEAPAATDDQAVDTNSNRARDRVARYMSIEIRQEQTSFRKAVFEAHNGRCFISGCDVPEALEAAHLHGRKWREGQNQATDGVLLRRDLHALYDRGLLDFVDGVARFDPRVVHHYCDLEGITVGVA
ncbi:HNH endonuclease signature motif containing protein [Caballeronia sp. GACF5]|uniref:HNH endonuclease signature motif containing protein n=1 Tax=Caballeronia sp. GACF5 TaxID=2921746 RepID=UPI0020292348|nr:HNH endonuclease signature motif containing protein [Caballeronia sp. GACF5]